ncbi:nucleotide pyrophosphohydrolase [bacterium]|nr:nucleotide pyrophosphohydrolase [bacterium]
METKPVDLQKILEFQRQFVREREWEKFHTPKNLAMALAGEAGELLELFQWLTAEESAKLTENPDKAQALRHEMSDILFYLLRLADHFHIDLEAALWEKLEQNARRYPVELARGNAKKYTELAPKPVS